MVGSVPLTVVFIYPHIFIAIMKPPILAQETARLEALRGYRILDTGPEQVFDDVTDLASFICRIFVKCQEK